MALRFTTSATARSRLRGTASERSDIAARGLDIEPSHGNLAAQVPFGVVLARALLDLGDIAAALAAPQRAVETMRAAQPLFLSPFETCHVLWRALHAATPPLIAQLEVDLLEVAERHVPPSSGTASCALYV